MWLELDQLSPLLPQQNFILGMTFLKLPPQSHISQHPLILDTIAPACPSGVYVLPDINASSQMFMGDFTTNNLTLPSSSPGSEENMADSKFFSSPCSKLMNF